MIDAEGAQNNELLELKAKLLGSLLFFTQTFYKIRTGRDFNISQPIGRESHQITICKMFTKIFKLEFNRLLINVEPGSGKSELCRHFIAWTLAHYPDSKYIYVSCSHELAAESTSIIKDIVSLPSYKKLFSINVDPKTAAKDNFKTLQGGAVFAAGSDGTIAGFDAGLPITDRFSGAIIMDDMHKPAEVHSDTTRNRVNNNFKNTIIHRARSPTVPFIFIGQRLREDDLPDNLINGFDGYKWEKVILKSIDESGNILNPSVHDKTFLFNLKENSPYYFEAQYQQNPQPAGGSLFKENWFYLTEKEPDILATFITVDTAETTQVYNDATVFSFWGLHKIKDEKTPEINIPDLYGLHWINCAELRIEPKDLESEFMSFYTGCMRHKVKPQAAYIEKKSTGVTLLSVLKNMRGLRVRDIDRTIASGGKVTRFINMQPYIANQQISLPKNGRHTEMCINHMGKITANNTHSHDDIADTCYDAIKVALIDRLIIATITDESNQGEIEIVRSMASYYENLDYLRGQRKW